MNDTANQPDSEQQGTISLIELDEFEFPRRELIKLFLRQRLRWYCWLFVTCVLILAVALAIFDYDWLYVYAFPPLILIIFLGDFCAALHDILSKKRYPKEKWTFDTNTAHLRLEDGAEAHFPLHHVTNVYRIGNYYHLVIDFINLIPVTAFRSEEDRIRFETEIFGDKFKTKPIMTWKMHLFFLLMSVCLLGLVYSTRFIVR
ncbi:MAG: hypothetical protein LBI05_08925 [Planctomycetaceae bacterium]|jgi:hypothetical protein|nr:hypothetical protein [Planctomycetaceae bacterium]